MIGLILLVIGSLGIWAAVGLEIYHCEPVYLLLMKVFPWMIALGAWLYFVKQRR